MSIATLLPLAIKISLILAVLAVGLKASASDILYLFRRPNQLLRAFAAMDVLVPLLAVGLAAGFALHPAVKIALITLALSPLPPVFPKKALKAGGGMSYTVGLMVGITLIAVVFIPLALNVLAKTFDIPMQMSAAAVWGLVFTSLLVPLVVGVVIHQIAPSFAERASGPVAIVASALLVVVVIPILIRVWPAVVSLIGNGTVLVMVVFALVALAIGHLLGGPEPENRTILALACGARHPGIAIAIAHANFPDQKLAPAAVVLYLLVSAIATVPYLKWTARQHGSIPGAMSTRSA